MGCEYRKEDVEGNVDAEELKKRKKIVNIKKWSDV